MVAQAYGNSSVIIIVLLQYSQQPYLTTNLPTSPMEHRNLFINNNIVEKNNG